MSDLPESLRRFRAAAQPTRQRQAQRTLNEGMSGPGRAIADGARALSQVRLPRSAPELRREIGRALPGFLAEATGLPSAARAGVHWRDTVDNWGSPRSGQDLGNAVANTIFAAAPFVGTGAFGRGAPRGALRAPEAATEPAARIPNMAREIGPNGMPIAQAQPTRNSFRGGSGDLREAARMGMPRRAGQFDSGTTIYEPAPGVEMEIRPGGQTLFTYNNNARAGRGTGAEAVPVFRAAQRALLTDIAENQRPVYRWRPDGARQADVYRRAMRNPPQGYRFSETPSGQMQLERTTSTPPPALPMDEASRMQRAREPLRGGTPEAMQRAREQGYTGPWYRGLSQPYDDAQANVALYTTDPRYANAFAGGEGGNVVPAMLRTRGARQVPWGEMEGPRGAYDEMWAGSAADDAVVSQSPNGHYFASVRPTHARSRFAAFDPSRSGESDLLALTNDPAADPMISRAAALRGLADAEGPRLRPPGSEDRYLFGRPTETTARQQRMADQGYDATPYYHGTRQEIQGPIRRSGSGAMGPGVYMARRPETTNTYAGTWSGRNAGEEIDLTAGSNVLPLHVRGRMADRNAWMAALDEAGGHNGYESGANAQPILERQGYVGVSDPANDWHVVFDPANIRLPWAQFDPARRNDPDLLAGLTSLAPIPIGAAALASREQTQRTRNRGASGRPSLLEAR